MKSAPTEVAPLAKRRRWRRRVALGVLLFAIIGAVLPGFWLPLAIEHVAPWALRRFAGLHLSIEEVERANWQTLELRGLVLRAEGEDPWIDVRVPRASADFDARQLVSEPIRAVRRAELTRPRVYLRLDATESDSAPADDGDFTLPSWPDRLPDLRVRDGGFELDGVMPQTLSVQGLELETSDGARLESSFSEVQLGGLFEADEFTDGRLTANYASGAWTEVTLDANDASLVRDARADLSEWDQRRFEFAASVSLRGAEGSAEALLTRDRMSGSVSIDAVPFAWLESFAPEGSALTGFGRLEGEWQFPLADPLAGSGEADLEVAGLSVYGAPPARLSGALVWADGKLQSNNLRIDQSENHLQLIDFSWQLDSTLLSAFHFQLSAEVRDMRSLAALAGTSMPDDPVPAHDLQLRARLADGRLLIERGFLDTVGGRLLIEEGVITENPTPDDPRRVALTANFEELSELGRLFSAADWNGALAGDLVYTDFGEGPKLTCALIGERVTIEDHELGNVQLEARIEPPQLVVTGFVSDGPAGLVRGTGVFDWDALFLRDVNLELDLRDLARLAPSAGVTGSATGALSLDGPLDQLDGSLALQSTELNFDGYTFKESSVRADFSGGDIRIESLRLADHAAQVELAGDLAFDSGRVLRSVAVERFRVAVSETNLELTEPALFSWDGERALIEGMQLTGSAGTLDIALDWGPAAREIDVVAQDLRLDELLRGRTIDDMQLDGLDGELHFAIVDEVATGRCDLTLRAFEWPGFGPPIDVRLRADQRDHVLSVDELLISGDDGELLRGKLHVPLAPLADEWLPDGPVEIELTAESGLARQIGLALGHPHTAGELALRFELGGTTSDPRGRLEVLIDDLLWAPAADRPALGPARLDLAVVIEPNQVRIERGSGALDTAEAIELSGHLNVSTDIRRMIADPAQVRAATEVALRFGTTDFDWQRVVVQLDRLGLPSGPVRTGVFSAELVIGGDLVTPLLTGSASLRDGSARMGNLPSIADVSSELRFAGRELTLENFSGELGGAPFKLTGTVALEEEDLVIDARLVGNDLLVVRQGGTRVRANVDATVSGPLSALVIGGRAEIAEGIYSTAIDVTSFLGGPKPTRARGIQIFRISDPPIRDARFDMQIGTAPGSSFMISTTTYKGGVRPDLHLGGTGALPILTGTVYFDAAVVSLPVTRLHVTSGTLVFDESNPFVPTLSIQAEGRMRGYDVFAQVIGPFDSTEVTLSSDPPLNGTELLNLVLTGRVPGDESTRAGDVAQQLATYLAKDFLAWWIAPEPGDQSSDSLMDRIEIITGEDVSKTGANTMEGRFRVAEDVTRDDDAIYLIAQRDEYDFYNFGIRISFRVK